MELRPRLAITVAGIALGCALIGGGAFALAPRDDVTVVPDLAPIEITPAPVEVPADAPAPPGPAPVPPAPPADLDDDDDDDDDGDDD